jgi:predicted GH43/DUF377 family glycosyl hydrolase
MSRRCNLDDQTVLLMRVAERPRSDIDPPADALTLDLSGPEPRVMPLRGGYRKEDVVPIAFVDPDPESMKYVPIYLPRDLPGLDSSDPRGVTFVHPKLHTSQTFLTQASHLRCARSVDGEHFAVDDHPAIWPSSTGLLGASVRRSEAHNRQRIRAYSRTRRGGRAVECGGLENR